MQSPFKTGFFFGLGFTIGSAILTVVGFVLFSGAIIGAALGAVGLK